MKLRNFLISGNFNFSSPFLLSSISRLMIHPHVLCNFLSLEVILLVLVLVLLLLLVLLALDQHFFVVHWLEQQLLIWFPSCSTYWIILWAFVLIELDCSNISAAYSGSIGSATLNVFSGYNYRRWVDHC